MPQSRLLENVQAARTCLLALIECYTLHRISESSVYSAKRDESFALLKVDDQLPYAERAVLASYNLLLLFETDLLALSRSNLKNISKTVEQIRISVKDEMNHNVKHLLCNVLDPYLHKGEALLLNPNEADWHTFEESVFGVDRAMQKFADAKGDVRVLTALDFAPLFNTLAQTVFLTIVDEKTHALNRVWRHLFHQLSQDRDALNCFEDPILNFYYIFLKTLDLQYLHSSVITLMPFFKALGLACDTAKYHLSLSPSQKYSDLVLGKRARDIIKAFEFSSASAKQSSRKWDERYAGRDVENSVQERKFFLEKYHLLLKAYALFETKKLHPFVVLRAPQNLLALLDETKFSKKDIQAVEYYLSTQSSILDGDFLKETMDKVQCDLMAQLRNGAATYQLDVSEKNIWDLAWVDALKQSLNALARKESGLAEAYDDNYRIKIPLAHSYEAELAKIETFIKDNQKRKGYLVHGINPGNLNTLCDELLSQKETVCTEEWLRKAIQLQKYLNELNDYAFAIQILTWRAKIRGPICIVPHFILRHFNLDEVTQRKVRDYLTGESLSIDVALYERLLEKLRERQSKLKGICNQAKLKETLNASFVRYLFKQLEQDGFSQGISWDIHSVMFCLKIYETDPDFSEMSSVMSKPMKAIVVERTSYSTELLEAVNAIVETGLCRRRITPIDLLQKTFYLMVYYVDLASVLALINHAGVFSAYRARNIDMFLSLIGRLVQLEQAEKEAVENYLATPGERIAQATRMKIVGVFSREMRKTARLLGGDLSACVEQFEINLKKENALYGKTLQLETSGLGEPIRKLKENASSFLQKLGYASSNLSSKSSAVGVFSDRHHVYSEQAIQTLIARFKQVMRAGAFHTGSRVPQAFAEALGIGIKPLAFQFAPNRKLFSPEWAVSVQSPMPFVQLSQLLVESIQALCQKYAVPLEDENYGLPSRGTLSGSKRLLYTGYNFSRLIMQLACNLQNLQGMWRNTSEKQACFDNFSRILGQMQENVDGLIDEVPDAYVAKVDAALMGGEVATQTEMREKLAITQRLLLSIRTLIQEKNLDRVDGIDFFQLREIISTAFQAILIGVEDEMSYEFSIYVEYYFRALSKLKMEKAFFENPDNFEKIKRSWIWLSEKHPVYFKKFLNKLGVVDEDVQKILIDPDKIMRVLKRSHRFWEVLGRGMQDAREASPVCISGKRIATINALREKYNAFLSSQNELGQIPVFIPPRRRAPHLADSGKFQEDDYKGMRKDKITVSDEILEKYIKGLNDTSVLRPKMESEACQRKRDNLNAHIEAFKVAFALYKGDRHNLKMKENLFYAYQAIKGRYPIKWEYYSLSELEDKKKAAEKMLTKMGDQIKALEKNKLRQYQHEYAMDYLKVVYAMHKAGTLNERLMVSILSPVCDTHSMAYKRLCGQLGVIQTFPEKDYNDLMHSLHSKKATLEEEESRIKKTLGGDVSGINTSVRGIQSMLSDIDNALYVKKYRIDWNLLLCWIKEIFWRSYYVVYNWLRNKDEHYTAAPLHERDMTCSDEDKTIKHIKQYDARINALEDKYSGELEGKSLAKAKKALEEIEMDFTHYSVGNAFR